MDENIKVVTILFTRYYDLLALFLHFTSGRVYTHVSISLDEDSDFYYSFNGKGFRREYPHRHPISKNTRAIKLEIPTECFEKIKAKIQEFEEKREELAYSKFGVFCCLLKIPYKREKKYFCSQFVAEMLHRSGSVNLKKKPVLYTPHQLFEELKRQQCLLKIEYCPV